ncbi:response regulator transcription factor [Prolixibacteraceae bacterium JC049]|nr:response regulator transcription factor [Prolixibacteraceae bacterium JC049]
MLNRTIIVEDEKPAARRLNRMLEKQGIQPVAILHSVKTAVEWLRQNKQPELLFLDIQLSDGLSFEIFEQVEVTGNIIFTTAYDEYALKAFKLKSIDYLLKPINEEELTAAIDKYKSFAPAQSSPFSSEQMMAIQQLMTANSQDYKERFTIKVGQHIRSVTTSDIECFFSEEKATYLATTEGKSLNIDYSLEQLDPLLNPKQFFRINRKFIINIDAIADIVVYSNSRLKIKLHHFNADEIIVSRERVKLFKEWLDK